MRVVQNFQRKTVPNTFLQRFLLESIEYDVFGEVQKSSAVLNFGNTNVGCLVFIALQV